MIPRLNDRETAARVTRRGWVTPEELAACVEAQKFRPRPLLDILHEFHMLTLSQIEAVTQEEIREEPAPTRRVVAIPPSQATDHPDPAERPTQRLDPSPPPSERFTSPPAALSEEAEEKKPDASPAMGPADSIPLAPDPLTAPPALPEPAPPRTPAVKAALPGESAAAPPPPDPLPPGPASSGPPRVVLSAEEAAQLLQAPIRLQSAPVTPIAEAPPQAASRGTSRRMPAKPEDSERRIELVGKVHKGLNRIVGIVLLLLVAGALATGWLFRKQLEPVFRSLRGGTSSKP